MPAPKTCLLPGEEYPRHYLEMYHFMRDYAARNGFPPTITEMVQNGFARSPSVITYYYGKMERLGMIRRAPRSVRAITLIPKKQWKKPQDELREYKFTPERKSNHGQDNA